MISFVFDVLRIRTLSQLQLSSFSNSTVKAVLLLDTVVFSIMGQGTCLPIQTAWGLPIRKFQTSVFWGPSGHWGVYEHCHTCPGRVSGPILLFHLVHWQFVQLSCRVHISLQGLSPSILFVPPRCSRCCSYYWLPRGCSATWIGNYSFLNCLIYSSV